MRKVIALLLMLSLCFCMIACSKGESSNSSTFPAEESSSIIQDDAYSEDYYTVTMTASFPLYTDPAVATSAIEYVAMANLYDPLVFVELDGSISPHVADSWEISDDGLTYTFFLKENISFHDGSNLNADDVAYSMNRVLEMGQGLSYLYTTYVDSAEATDEYTVVFHMKQIYGPFIKALGCFYILNKDLVEANYSDGFYGEKGDYGAGYLNDKDAGSGPYTITEYVMGESFKASIYEDWFKGFKENTPKYLRIIPSVDTVTIKTLMENRTLTIVDEWQSTTTVNDLDAIEGVGVAALNIGSMASIEMNTKIAPTDCKHFRKAMSYLFDYNTAVTQIYPDASIPFGPISSVYEGSLDSEPMKFDLEMAKSELALSEYANQLEDYTVDLYWLSDVPDMEKLSLLLQVSAKEVGININIVKTTYMNSIELATSVETTPHMMISYPAASFSDASAVFLMRYHSSNSGTSNQFEWLQNPDIDEAIEDAIATLDDNDRYAKYREIQKNIIDLAPTIWMFESPELRAYQEGFLEWDAAEAAKQGTFNCAVIGRYVYLPEMRIYPEKRAELLKK
ncbi:MAG: ABC transporter substrate-binding protein [Saccharofermentanales bacterium]|jgi:peptide/nickel transport system substrate-binding protein